MTIRDQSTPTALDLERRRWSRTSALSFAALVVALAAWVGSGFLADFSGLDQGEDSWGYFAGTLLFLFMFAPLPTLLVGGLCLGGAVSGRSTWAWAAAILEASFAVGGLGLAVYVVGTEPPAGQVFGALAGASALVLFVPLMLCWRARTQSLRSRT